MNAPSVTITILAYRSKETIRQCVLSAIALEYDGRLDIRIREQGGDADEFAAIREMLPPGGSIPNVRIFLSRGDNIGFAAGQNVLIRESDTDLILCLNADAVLMPDFLSRAVPAFFDPTVGAVQGKILRWPKHLSMPFIRRGLPPSIADAPRIIDTTGLVPLRNRRILNRGQGEEDRGQYDVADDVFGPDGAAPLYRRAALEDAAIPQKTHGGLTSKSFEYFDEDFFAYKEDVDLAWRLQWRGWKTVYVPEAVAWHGRGSGDSAAHSAFAIIAERRKISPKAKYYSFANQRLLQMKNESATGLARDVLPWIVKEIGAWAFALLTEPRTLPAVFRILRFLPSALRKRKWIMEHRKPGADPYRFFT